MTDKISKVERSWVMSRIKSKETKFEIGFRKILWGLGCRYRKNNKEYFGKPDLISPSRKLTVFLDSCFWHGCRKHLRLPAQNKDYWKKKIARNIQRDKTVSKYYRKKRWIAIRIWEHQLKTDTQTKKEAEKLMRYYQP